MQLSAIITASLLTLIAPQEPVRRVIPNDPFWDRQISYLNPGGTVGFDLSSRNASIREFDCAQGVDLNITPAWAITTGSKDVVVAILDDGFFYGHEDIRDNIWSNPGESGLDDEGYPKETNGIDDDNNGFVDDVMGWDFAFDDPDPDCYIFDGMDNTQIAPYWHSISAMGIIGAKGNNGIGVAGINWDVSMMLLKMGAQGRWPREVFNRSERAAQAIRYAADNGARVINWSGFVRDALPEDLAVLKEAIEYAGTKDVLLIVGSGNAGTNTDLTENYFFPQCFDCPNILNVAEITFTGELDRNSGLHRVSGSCFGVETVDVAAIARNYTTDLYNSRSIYRLGGGTSNSAPVATGVAALMLSVNPELSHEDLKRILMGTARDLPTLTGKVASGGMVDAFFAVEEARRLGDR